MTLVPSLVSGSHNSEHERVSVAEKLNSAVRNALIWSQSSTEGWLASKYYKPFPFFVVSSAEGLPLW